MKLAMKEKRFDCGMYKKNSTVACKAYILAG